MLTLHEVQTELARITYKPGWTLKARQSMFEGVVLRIVAEGLINSYRPKETIDIGIDSFLPPVESVEQLHSWLAWRLDRIESHESREWLKRDGRVLFDPHVTPEM